MFSKVEARGVTVLEDKTRSLEGKSSGVRRTKKYWNGFGKSGRGTLLKHDLDDDGSILNSLVDGSTGQHVYVVDVFQYGISGLDLRVPDGSDGGKKRAGDGSVSGGSKKRAKMESDIDSGMEGMDIGGMTGSAGDDLVTVESPVRGVVRVISNMKLYWYEPK